MCEVRCASSCASSTHRDNVRSGVCVDLCGVRSYMYLLLRSEHTQRQWALGRVCRFISRTTHPLFRNLRDLIALLCYKHVQNYSPALPQPQRPHFFALLQTCPELLTSSSATSESSTLCSAVNLSRTPHQLFRNLRVLNALLCCKFVQNYSPALPQPQSPQRFALLRWPPCLLQKH
jgi:hypothetical protein